VAEVDPPFIRTHGDNFIHVSEIDYLVEETQPFPVGTPPPPDEEQGTLEVIGEFASSLIREGKTQGQRAEALISIAHPDFQPELQKAAKKMFWP
jgi:acyl-CoA hydrolase